MSTSIDDDKKRGEVNILSLPPEILLKIFEHSIGDIRDVISLNKVCKQFSKVAQAASLYKKVKILNNESVDVSIRILRKHGKDCRKLVMKNVSGGMLVEFFKEVSYIQLLTSLEIKAVRIPIAAFYIIQHMIKYNSHLRCLKFKNVMTQELLVSMDNNWLDIFQAIASRPMEKLSIVIPPPTSPNYRLWNFNLFLQKSKDTLKLLKFSTAYVSGIEGLSDCSKLKKLHLKVYSPFIYYRSWSFLSPSLNKLSSINILPIMGEDGNFTFLFFSAQRYVNLKKIKIDGFYGMSNYIKILDAIATNCPNVNELVMINQIKNRDFRPLWETVLKLLNSCKVLKQITFPWIILSDLMKIDEMLSAGNYPMLEYFDTYTPVPDIITEGCEYEQRFARGEQIFKNFLIFTTTTVNHEIYHGVHFVKRRN